MSNNTIHLYGVRAKCYTEGNYFIIELNGYRGEHTGNSYRIVIHGYWYFPHVLLEQMYSAIKVEVDKILTWQKKFKNKIED